jgi:hypothetical protein
VKTLFQEGSDPLKLPKVFIQDLQGCTYFHGLSGVFIYDLNEYSVKGTESFFDFPPVELGLTSNLFRVSMSVDLSSS